MADGDWLNEAYDEFATGFPKGDYASFRAGALVALERAKGRSLISKGYLLANEAQVRQRVWSELDAEAAAVGRPLGADLDDRSADDMDAHEAHDDGRDRRLE